MRSVPEPDKAQAKAQPLRPYVVMALEEQAKKLGVGSGIYVPCEFKEIVAAIEYLNPDTSAEVLAPHILPLGGDRYALRKLFTTPCTALRVDPGPELVWEFRQPHP